MTKLFAVVNGEVIESLEENTTPTYTRIHCLCERKERPEKEANMVDSLKNLVGASRK
jgi:hypothetical protein